MKLIVGLGNPGLKYKKTWHNIGFVAIDEIAAGNFSKFKKIDKFKAKIAKGEIDAEKVILAKPQTFMNLSGQAVQALAHYYKVSIQDIYIIHDDMDLPIGKLRISQNATDAGHNGIKSITQELGSKGYTRFRLGVKNESNKAPTDKYVLQKIDKQSKVAVDQVIKKTTEAVKATIVQGIEKAMNQFN